MIGGWKIRRLGDLAAVGAGNSAPQDKTLFQDGAFPFFRTADAGRIRFGDISEATDYLNDTGVQGLRQFPKGTILFPKSGASTFLNHRVMLGVDGYVSSHLATIVVDRSQIDERFLLYYLSTVYAQDMVQDHGYPSLNLPAISGISVRYPVLVEQRRIVSILDEAFDGIATAKANAEKNLQNARAIFASTLDGFFVGGGEGWESKRLEQIGTTQTGSTPKTSDSDNYGDFIPFIKPGDFRVDGSLNYENEGLSELGLSKTRKVTAGSLLMVCIGATIGKCGYTDRAVTTNQQINALKPNKGIVPKFVYYQMRTEDFQKRVLFNSGQATLPIINKSKWSALTVGMPVLTEQKEIVSKLDAIAVETRNLESIYQRKLAALDELKQSLLHQAFSGAL